MHEQIVEPHIERIQRAATDRARARTSRVPAP